MPEQQLSKLLNLPNLEVVKAQGSMITTSHVWCEIYRYRAGQVICGIAVIALNAKYANKLSKSG
jgi:hypothetical protein